MTGIQYELMQDHLGQRNSSRNNIMEHFDMLTTEWQRISKKK